jgi:acetyl-CoA C-acetyltransferase
MSNVALVSYALEGYRDSIDSRGNEVVFEVAREALDKAGLTRDHVDAVIGCGQDAFNGVTVSFGMKACAVGGYNKPSTRIQNGGAYAIAQARAKILAGKADCVMIGTEEPLAEFDEKTVSNISQEPVFNRPIGHNYIQSNALAVGSHLQESDATEEDYARVVQKNYEAAADNPYAHRSGEPEINEILKSEHLSWPVREAEVGPVSAGAAAIVLTSADLAREATDTPVWIEGAGLGSSRYAMNENESMTELPSLRAARQEAYEEAGVTDPMSEIDFAEVYDPIAPMEILSYEALDFCSDGKGIQLLRDGVTAPGGDLPVNRSGGAVVTNPLNTGGLYRTAMAMSALRDDDDGITVADSERAVVTGGDHMLGNRGRTDSVLVLETEAS